MKDDIEMGKIERGKEARQVNILKGMREGKNRDNSEMGQKKGRHETIGENEGGKEEGDGDR